MIKIIADSGSSLKKEEAVALGVGLLPLRINIGGKDYLDGVDMDSTLLYKEMEKTNEFPITSLPRLDIIQSMVDTELQAGNDVLIVCISSGLSSTYSVIANMFEGNPHVLVYDSLTAVGGMKIIIREAVANSSLPLDELKIKLDALRDRVELLAVPATLDYLIKGGRLKKGAYVVGKVLKILPLLAFDKGALVCQSKQFGLRLTVMALSSAVKKTGIDSAYPIIGCYTKNDSNLLQFSDKLKSTTKISFTETDDLNASMAAHWGPDAFGIAYVRK